MHTQSEWVSELEGRVFRVSWLLSQINGLVCVIIDYCDKNIVNIFLGFLKNKCEWGGPEEEIFM